MKALLDAAINATAPARRKVMGLLTDKAREVPQNARNLWGEMQNYPAELNALVSPQMNQQVQQAMTAPSQGFDKEKGMQMAMDYLQTTNPVGGLLAHTVYHGSPHKFNKFDMSKIGTGEGAQAYGHGLYFAEAPDVAKSYIPPNAQAQETIAGLLKKETARAQRYSNEGGMEVYEMFQKGYTPAGIRANIDNLIESGEAHPDYIKKMEQAYKKATEIYKANPAGQMYKVDIPDESIPRMLDWDRSLDQQSPEVIAALEKVGITQPWELVTDTGHALGRTFKTQAEALAEAPAGWTARVRPSTNKGNAVYENLAAQVGNAGRYDNPLPKDYAATSELLKQAGIPGIKYLDAISRGAGDGSRNFVLFQDDLARILEINGQPTGLIPWGAGEFGGLLTR